jgi:hypothetical protein
VAVRQLAAGNSARRDAHTVDSHVRGIMNKLGFNACPDRRLGIGVPAAGLSESTGSQKQLRGKTS